MNFPAQNIFSIRNEADFNQAALEIFNYQLNHNPVYGQFVQYLNIKPESIKNYRDIPCMPVEMFKNHKVLTGKFQTELEFHSSKTTGQIPSRHFVKDATLYQKSLLLGFQEFLGEASDYTIFALLPSYLERKNASLIHMVNCLIKENRNDRGGFYLNNYQELIIDMLKAQAEKQNVLLWGVSFALTDLCEQFSGSIKGIRIIETGGMKGRKKEITREALHDMLNSAFKPTSIDSEYGMTELLSQAWSINGSAFQTPAWMKICIRDMHDPRSLVKTNQTGGINVIDLANIHSCSFLETRDIGKQNENGFSVLGRLDNSEIRGCNLLVQ